MDGSVLPSKKNIASPIPDVYLGFLSDILIQAHAPTRLQRVGNTSFLLQ
jgi:hypothetical protein